MPGVRGRSSEFECWGAQHDGVKTIGDGDQSDSLNEITTILSETAVGKEEEKRSGTSLTNNTSDEDVLKTLKKKIKNAKKRIDKRRKIKERKYLETADKEISQRGELKKKMGNEPVQRIAKCVK